MDLDLLDGHAPLTAACFGFAAAAESFLAALLVTKFIRKRITLATLREVIVLIFIATLFSNALTALLGVGVNALMDVSHAGKAAVDAATNMIICPSILQLIYLMIISTPGLPPIPGAVSVNSSKSA